MVFWLLKDFNGIFIVLEVNMVFCAFKDILVILKILRIFCHI